VFYVRLTNKLAHASYELTKYFSQFSDPDFIGGTYQRENVQFDDKRTMTNETNVLWWIFWCSTLKAGKHPSYIFLCFSIWFLGIYNHSVCDQCREIMISAIYLYDFSLSVIWTFFLDLECYCQIMTSQIKIITLALNAYTVILSDFLLL
jgi:hypothetical protein